MARMQTEVVIVGAGPAGLLLGQLLGRRGIENVILERQSGDYVLGRIRAGLLEQGTVDLLEQAGAVERLRREGMVHGGTQISTQGARHRIDLQALTGRSMTVYGQTEITRDLMTARAGSGQTTIYEACHVGLEALASSHPIVHAETAAGVLEIRCRVVAGCDGFHGVCRPSIPADCLAIYERTYPFGWLGVLSDTAPVSEELIYVQHERGFALCSMRSPTRSRYYLQCAADESVEAWSDDRFWTELSKRLDPEARGNLVTGPSIEKSVAPLLSFVAEPMRYGRLVLAGDAAHIVPPTGAKGLNLAASDVGLLSEAIRSFLSSGQESVLDAYSRQALRQVWQAERFSWWLTTLLHTFDGATSFDRRLQRAEIDHVLASPAAARAFAENYVGLRF